MTCLTHRHSRRGASTLAATRGPPIAGQRVAGRDQVRDRATTATVISRRLPRANRGRTAANREFRRVGPRGPSAGAVTGRSIERNRLEEAVGFFTGRRRLRQFMRLQDPRRREHGSYDRDMQILCTRGVVAVRASRPCREPPQRAWSRVASDEIGPNPTAGLTRSSARRRGRSQYLGSGRRSLVRPRACRMCTQAGTSCCVPPSINCV